MRFTERGAEDGPVALLIHALLVDETSFDALIDEMGDGYRFILPTLDGHYPGAPDFLSAAQEAHAILRYLDEHDIRDIDVLIGTSLGGVVGVELLALLAKVPGMSVKRAVIDGAPLFNSRLIYSIALKKMRDVIDWSRNRPDEARAKIHAINPYHVEAMLARAASTSDATVVGVVGSVCRFSFPRIDPTVQEHTTFTWGSKEIALRSRSRVAATYPRAPIVVKFGYDHCGYLMDDVRAYVAEFVPA